MLTIRMVTNGWILEDSHDEESVRYHVFEYKDSFMDSEKEEVEAFARLLWTINDIVGPSTSRYSKHRISVSIVKGDKCDDHFEDESVERSDTTGASGTDGS